MAMSAFIASYYSIKHGYLLFDSPFLFVEPSFTFSFFRLDLLQFLQLFVELLINHYFVCFILSHDFAYFLKLSDLDRLNLQVLFATH